MIQFPSSVLSRELGQASLAVALVGVPVASRITSQAPAFYAGVLDLRGNAPRPWMGYQGRCVAQFTIKFSRCCQYLLTEEGKSGNAMVKTPKNPPNHCHFSGMACGGLNDINFS